MNELELFRMVRRLIREGRLPRGRSISLFAAYGRAEPCAICSLPIEASGVAYELRFDSSDWASPLTVHYRCFDVWDSARTTLNSSPRYL